MQKAEVVRAFEQRGLVQCTECSAWVQFLLDDKRRICNLCGGKMTPLERDFQGWMLSFSILLATALVYALVFGTSVHVVIWVCLCVLYAPLVSAFIIPILLMFIWNPLSSHWFMRGIFWWMCCMHTADMDNTTDKEKAIAGSYLILVLLLLPCAAVLTFACRDR